MKNILSFAVAFVALVVLAGCASGGAAGKWSGKPDTAKAFASLPADQRAAAEKMVAGMAIDLELKSDKTFVLTATGAPGAEKPVNGKWEQKEKTVTLTPDDTKQPPITATVSEDGKTMTMNDPSGMMSIVFTKA